MDELKPCPFCGGKAEYKRTAIKTNGCWTDVVCVRCTICDSRTGRVLYNAKKHPNCEEYEEAAEAWNKRIGEKQMKEYTVIHTVQFTEVFKIEGDMELIPTQETEARLKRCINADDIKVINRQIFVRDLPNTSEVVVGTPDLAVQGG